MNPPLTRVWARRGQPARVPAAGRDQKAVVFGAWNFRTERLVWQISERKNSEAFLKLLRQIRRRRPSGRPAKLVTGNAPYHRSNKVKEFLAAHRAQLQPFWLPPYSPELNLLERVWLYLKEKVINNYFFGTFARLTEAVAEACRQLNGPAPRFPTSASPP